MFLPHVTMKRDGLGGIAGRQQARDRTNMKLSTRLMVAIVALVLLTAATIGFVTYRSIETVALPRGLARIDNHARLLAFELEASVRGARADVIGFRSAVAIDGIIRATVAGGAFASDGITADQWRDRLATRFAAELAAKPNYAEFRIIGVADGGREILRVDRTGPGGAIRIVPEAELQRQGNLDYFKRAIGLPPGTVDVTGVELNEEQGVIQTPHVPVIRAATPIHAPDGRPFGIVIITVDLRSGFSRVRAADAGYIGTLYIVNDRGDYLLNPDPAREFGFLFGRPSKAQDDFPEIAGLLLRNDPEPRVLQDRTGAQLGVALASARLADGPRVTLIETVPYSDVVASTIAVLDSTLQAGIAAVLVAITLAALLTRSLTRPLVQMTTAVEAFARDKPMAVPTNASGEIGVLARAFNHMAREVQDKTAALRNSEGAARRNAEILDKIVASMGDAVLVADENGKMLFANPAAKRLFGDHPDINSSQSGGAYRRFLPDGMTPLPPEQSPVARAIGGESVDNAEVVLHREGDSKAIHILANGRPIRDPDGTLKGAVLVYRDVTQARETERALSQSQKMDAIGQLTGGIAHDFNNILTVITGTIEILAEAVAADPKLTAVAKMIDEAAERGAGLTQHLLAFARKQPLQPRETDINALVVEAAKLLQPALGEHIEIDSVLEDKAWPALVDGAQLTTALLNLAVNARDAMPTGGKLTIETGNVVLDEAYAHMHTEVRPGSYVMIAVSDTGNGIPAAILDKVFEPFFTTKDASKGTGLGLSMVYGFVKQSNGHIKIYSEEGHGTSVKIYLPRTREAAATTGQSPVAAPVRGGDEVVLVVEDDVLVRDHVIAQIESLGYRTFAAALAAEALAIIDREPKVDLLFTDVIMPGGMNGRQLADEAQRRQPSIKVLFTSGYTENAIMHHGRLDPGVLLLAKPYRKSDLARMIRIALGIAPQTVS